MHDKLLFSYCMNEDIIFLETSIDSQEFIVPYELRDNVLDYTNRR